MRVTLCWRDGSVSEQTFEVDEKYWAAAEVEQVKLMIEQNVDQEIIMRAFPTKRWSTILELYAYHFNNRRWPKTYTGTRKYPCTMRWIDTDEYQAEQVNSESVTSDLTSDIDQ